MPPKGWLYTLYGPEKKAMKEYIQGALQQKSSVCPLVMPGLDFLSWGKITETLLPVLTLDFMVKNHYPLLLSLSAFELVQGFQIFTKLNLHNTSHLVRIQVGEERKTEYNTPRDHYEYLVMSFRLTRKPTLFQDLVLDILHDMLNIFVLVYLDDPVTFSQSEEEHMVQVFRVLERLLQHQLYVKVESVSSIRR